MSSADLFMQPNARYAPYAVYVLEELDKDGEKNLQKIRAFLRHIG